jgi:hypothetical protein
MTTTTNVTKLSNPMAEAFAQIIAAAALRKYRTIYSGASRITPGCQRKNAQERLSLRKAI